MNEQSRHATENSALSVRKKRILDPLSTRQHIIDAALNEFTERGFDGARMDAIAKSRVKRCCT